MCLAAAYKILNGQEEKICSDISHFEVRPGKVILTDFLGRETIVEGTLLSSDLSDNIIRIIGIPEKSNLDFAEIVKEYGNTKDYFVQKCNITILDITEHGAVGQMPVVREIYNGMEAVHGGAIATLADTVSGVAAIVASGCPCVTLSNNMNYVCGKTDEGMLTATAKVLHVGFNTVVTTVTICDENEKLMAYATFTYCTQPNYVAKN